MSAPLLDFEKCSLAREVAKLSNLTEESFMRIMEPLQPSELTTKQIRAMAEKLWNAHRVRIAVDTGRVATTGLGEYVKAGLLTDATVARLKELAAAVSPEGAVGEGPVGSPASSASTPGEGGPVSADRADLSIINATALGGGVAEMRPDTIRLLRDGGCRAEWLVIDGFDEFYGATVHIHEGVQNPNYHVLTLREMEVLQLVWIWNFVRMTMAGHLRPDLRVLWIDDPQPAGLLPLVKAAFPRTKVVWRCHIHADPEPSIGNFLHQLVTGKIIDSPSFALVRQFISVWLASHDAPAPASAASAPFPSGLSPSSLRADRAVFHLATFGQALRLSDGGVPCSIFGPAVNPLALKNLPLPNNFVVTTLRKYGVMGALETEVPPLVVEISRVDPYKGPLELIASFVAMLTALHERGEAGGEGAAAALKLARETRLVYAFSLPDDNPSGMRLLRAVRAYIDSIPVDALPPSLGGDWDVRKRMHFLRLQDTSALDAAVNTLVPATREAAEEAASTGTPLVRAAEMELMLPLRVRELCMECHTPLPTEAEVTAGTAAAGGGGAPLDARMYTHALTLVADAVQRATQEACTIGPSPAGGAAWSHVLHRVQSALQSSVWPTREQHRALLRHWSAGATGVPAAFLERLRSPLGVLLAGRELNHLEVNALQTAGCVRVQFSSKEGFGLVVSEAMLKHASGRAGVMVATSVGGVAAQVCGHEGAIAVSYPSAEVAASLAGYSELEGIYTSSTSEAECTARMRELYARVAGREVTRAFASAMTTAIGLPADRREHVSALGHRHVLDNFSTPANVINVLGACTAAVRGEGAAGEEKE